MNDDINRWVTQTRMHSEDTKGNCTEACVASILNIPLEEVPDFHSNDYASNTGDNLSVHDYWERLSVHDYWERFENFLGSHDVTVDFMLSVNVHTGLREHTGPREIDNRIYLACGPGSRGVSHMVIYRNGSLFHDPHPSREGLQYVSYSIILYPKERFVFPGKPPEY